MLLPRRSPSKSSAAAAPGVVRATENTRTRKEQTQQPQRTKPHRDRVMRGQSETKFKVQPDCTGRCLAKYLGCWCEMADFDTWSHFQALALCWGSLDWEVAGTAQALELLLLKLTLKTLRSYSATSMLEKISNR